MYAVLKHTGGRGVILLKQTKQRTERIYKSTMSSVWVLSCHLGNATRTTVRQSTVIHHSTDGFVLARPQDMNCPSNLPRTKLNEKHLNKRHRQMLTPLQTLQNTLDKHEALLVGQDLNANCARALWHPTNYCRFANMWCFFCFVSNKHTEPIRMQCLHYITTLLGAHINTNTANTSGVNRKDQNDNIWYLVGGIFTFHNFNRCQQL